MKPALTVIDDAARRRLLRCTAALAAAALALPALPARAALAPRTRRLAELVNAHRVAVGLSRVPLSRALTDVAEAHLRDLETQPRGESCNVHSWSDKGPWSPCCYSDERPAAACMAAKPREISGNRYRGNGYEIAATGNGMLMPEAVMASWLGSPSHLEVIVQRGVWSRSVWRALGVAMSDRHALVWFGDQEDPSGAP